MVMRYKKKEVLRSEVKDPRHGVRGAGKVGLVDREEDLPLPWFGRGPDPNSSSAGCRGVECEVGGDRERGEGKKRSGMVQGRVKQPNTGIGRRGREEEGIDRCENKKVPLLKVKAQKLH